MADDLKIVWLESRLYFPEQIYKVYNNKKSIKVPFVLVNLVGSVIIGYRLCDIKVSKKLLYVSFSFNFSKFILKSPAKMKLLLLFSKDDIMCANSLVNEFKSSFLLLGGL